MNKAQRFAEARRKAKAEQKKARKRIEKNNK